MKKYAPKRYRRGRAPRREAAPIRYNKRNRLPAPAGLGPRHTATLRYVDQFSLLAGAGTTASHVFRANDVYDPDFTAVGHQPMGFDQLMAFYDHFTVIGSKICVQMVDDGSSVTNPPFFGICLSDDGLRVAGAASINALLEQYGTTNVVQTGRVFGPQMGNYQTQRSMKFSSSNYFQKRNLVGESQYRGSAGASPTETAFYEVFVASASGNDPGICVFLATIEYIVVFTERKRVVGS